ncbi:conserved exported hypothetical protein [Paraburkholderia tropica]|nr:conserved exported hypothetical protein [Paraburkholderia tropica]
MTIVCIKKQCAWILLIAGLFFSFRAANAAVECEMLSDYASKTGVYIPGDDAQRVVTGDGRLQFYSAPDFSCKMNGVFVIKGQLVDAYTEYKGVTSVVYLGTGTEPPVTGWVRSNRLNPTGKGIAPSQKDSE